MRDRALILILMMITMESASYGQSMYGNTLGNYAGVNSALLNPSSTLNSKLYMDIQILGADIFFQNNYLFINKSDYKFSNFFNSGYVWPVHNEEYGVEKRSLYFYNNNRLKNAFNQQWLLGPGFMINWGRQALTVFFGFREVESIRNVPYELANFSWLGLHYPPQQNINYKDRIPVRAAGMAWGEIGISYANTFFARGFSEFSGGITIKRLFGATGFYFYSTDLNYIIPDDSTIIVNNMAAEAGMALPVYYNKNQANTDPLIKGGGFGFDVGFTFKRLLRYHDEQYYPTLCARPNEEYLYRIGVALIDIGGVRFANNAVKVNIDNRSAIWNNVNKLPYKTIDWLIDTISYRFYGDKSAARTGDKFTVWLPSALSAQFDYRINRKWFVNSSFIYGIPLTKSAIVRPSEIAVVPRYETPGFEVNFPLSLYDFTQPRIGLSLRLYGLTVGTEKLGSYFGFSNFTGLDFYFSIRILFHKGDCKIKGPMHCGENRMKR